MQGSGTAGHKARRVPQQNRNLLEDDRDPHGVIAQVRVTDGCGSDYSLPYPCKLTKDGWVNAASGKPLMVRATYWKLHVETTPRTKVGTFGLRAKAPQLARN
jgi:hypothetical protein